MAESCAELAVVRGTAFRMTLAVQLEAGDPPWSFAGKTVRVYLDHARTRTRAAVLTTEGMTPTLTVAGDGVSAVCDLPGTWTADPANLPHDGAYRCFLEVDDEKVGADFPLTVVTPTGGAAQ